MRRTRAIDVFTTVAIFVLGGAGLAAEKDTPRAAMPVALSFDAGSDTLLKAHAHALYRSDDTGRRWTRVSLPAAVQKGRIAAAATATKGKSAWYIAGPGIGVLRSDNHGCRAAPHGWQRRQTSRLGSPSFREKRLKLVQAHTKNGPLKVYYISEKRPPEIYASH